MERGTFNWQTGIPDSGTHIILFTVNDGYLVDIQRVIIKIEGFSTYSVTYEGNGNTEGTVPLSQTKTHGVALTLALNTGGLAKTGYIFTQQDRITMASLGMGQRLVNLFLFWLDFNRILKSFFLKAYQLIPPLGHVPIGFPNKLSGNRNRTVIFKTLSACYLYMINTP